MFEDTLPTLGEALEELPTYGADRVKVIPLVGHHVDGTIPVHLEVYGMEAETPHAHRKALLPAGMDVEYRWFEVPSKRVRVMNKQGGHQFTWNLLVRNSSSPWMHEERDGWIIDGFKVEAV